LDIAGGSGRGAAARAGKGSATPTDTTKIGLSDLALPSDN
jgi:hypothetical protein